MTDSSSKTEYPAWANGTPNAKYGKASVDALTRHFKGMKKVDK